MTRNHDDRRLREGSEQGSDPHRPSAPSKARSNIRLAKILVGVAFVFYFGIMAYFGILALQAP